MNSQKFPIVSVLIPTYNSAPTIVRAVESVLNQTFQDLEVIVVDDGSTDETRQILDPYLNRIRYIYQENQERSAARNRGIAESRGEYIAFLDADDWWLPRKLERQVAMLDVNPAVGMVYTAHQLVQPDGEIRPSPHPPGVDDPGSELFPRLVMRNVIGSPSKIMVRAHLLKKVGGFDESVNGTEDWDICLRVAAECLVGYVAEPLTCYQLRKGNDMERIIARNAQRNWISIIYKLFERPKIIEQYGHLEMPAKAAVLMRSSLVDCALKKFDVGAVKLAQAVELYPSFLTPPLIELGEWIIEFLCFMGNSNAQEVYDISKSIAFIDCFWTMLPSNPKKELSREKRNIKSRWFAHCLFLARFRHNLIPARSYALQLLRFDLSRLRDVKFLKVLLRLMIVKDRD